MCSSSSMIRMRLLIFPLMSNQLPYGIAIYSLEHQSPTGWYIAIIPDEVTQKCLSLGGPEGLLNRGAICYFVRFMDRCVGYLDNHILNITVRLSDQKPPLI